MSPREPRTIRDGLVAAAEQPLAQFRASLPRTVTEDAYDAIHDTRVALRRIGALLRAFAPVLPGTTVNAVRREIRWLRREFGPVRDLDVFIHETIPELSTLFESEPGLDILLAIAQRRRAPLDNVLAKTISGSRCARFVKLLDDVFGPDGPKVRRRRAADASALSLDAPFRPFAAAELNRRYKKLRKGGERIDNLGEDELHRMRIRLRNFRYVCDGFRELLPEGRYAEMRSAMTKLQDHMGALNDAVTAPVLVADLAAHANGVDESTALARAAGLVAGWGAARRQVLRATLEDPWWRMMKRADRMFAALKT